MTKDQSTAEKLTECAHNYKKTYKTTNKPMEHTLNEGSTNWD